MMPEDSSMSPHGQSVPRHPASRRNPAALASARANHAAKPAASVGLKSLSVIG
jgi:hypothetical protein